MYRASDLVAVPSYSESFGLVAIEAQASGVPVLAADVGGLGVAVENGVTGVLVDGHDIDHWTAELDRLLGDLPKLEAMGAAAHEHAQHFSWDHTADQLLAGYGKADRDVPQSHRTAGRRLARCRDGQRRGQRRRSTTGADRPPIRRTTKWSTYVTTQVTTDLSAIIEDFLGERELTYSRKDSGGKDADYFVVELPGEKKLKTTVLLTVGPHGLRLEAFVCRKPDENSRGRLQMDAQAESSALRGGLHPRQRR